MSMAAASRALSTPSVSDPEYAMLYKHCFEIYSGKKHLRGLQVEIGCKISALLYLLFCMLWEKNRRSRDRALFAKPQLDIDAFVESVQSIIHLKGLVYMTNPFLNSIFLENHPRGNCGVLIGDDITSHTNRKGKPYETVLAGTIDDLLSVYQVTVFGIISTENPDKSVEGRIDHYFPVRKEEDHYFLISSYATAGIAISQYETPLNVEEFLEFIRQLSITPRNPAVIDGFVRKYFLDPSHIIESEPKSPAEKEAAIVAEVAGYTNPESRFEVVAFLEAIDMIWSKFNPSGGKTRRSRKRRRRGAPRTRLRESLLHR